MRLVDWFIVRRARRRLEALRVQMAATEARKKTRSDAAKRGHARRRLAQ